MPKIAKELSALEVGRLSGAGYHAVGTVAGLYLQITGGGAKSWVYRVKVGTKRREIGLGPYPAVRLADAHAKARQTREMISEGVDPIERKKSLLSEMLARQAQELTFSQAADAFIAANRDTWRNPKHSLQWQSTIDQYAKPVIGGVHVRDVKLPHVLKVLEPIWTEKNETASRIRGRIEQILDWARVRGHRSGENPAAWRGNLDKILPKPSKVQRSDNQPAVLVAEVGRFMVELSRHEGAGARALEFVALTAARSGEVRGVTWRELDLDAKVWIVPGTRMKAGKEHRVPLSDRAVALLRAQPRMADTELVFPSVRGKELSDATMSQLMRRMGFKNRAGRICVPHGLRSTFRDWAGERTGYPQDVVEAALAHTRGDKTEAAYFRSDLFDKRRRLMADWADFLGRVESPEVDNVVPMRGAA